MSDIVFRVGLGGGLIVGAILGIAALVCVPYDYVARVLNTMEGV